MTHRHLHALVGLVLLLAGCSGTRQVPLPKAPENGTWSICYDEAGMPDLYENPGQNPPCDEPSRLLWPRLPIKTYVDAESTSIIEVLRAFAAWEEWLDRPVFVLVPEVEDAQLVIWSDTDYLVSICGETAAACAPHRRDSEGVLSAGVVLDPEYVRADVLAHELGHTLGLAHDPHDRRSIMYPSPEWYLPRLGQYDADLLKALYHGR